MPLLGYCSLCEKKQKRIVSRNQGNRQTHIANNSKEYEVTHYKIDGIVITEGDKCDFLLLKESDKKVAYFIELKGSDLEKAARQIDSTEKKLAVALKDYSFLYRIVANKCKTQEIENCNFKKYRLKWGHRLAYTTAKMEENL